MSDRLDKDIPVTYVLETHLHANVPVPRPASLLTGSTAPGHEGTHAVYRLGGGAAPDDPNSDASPAKTPSSDIYDRGAE